MLQFLNTILLRNRQNYVKNQDFTEENLVQYSDIIVICNGTGIKKRLKIHGG